MVYAIDISTIDFVPKKFTDIATFLKIILPLTMIGSALIFLVMALFGGFTWLTAGGNPENLAKAQKTFVSAIVGLVIVVFAFILTKMIGYILNVQIL